MDKKIINSDETCECMECRINSLIDCLYDGLKSYEFENIKYIILVKINMLANVDKDRKILVCDC